MRKFSGKGMTELRSDAILIRGARIIDPARDLDQVGDILVVGEYIQAAGDPSGVEPPSECQTIEAKGLVACPGFIDLHCHLREPGYEHKETIATGTAAAARGGFTTLCCMPNTNPSIDSAAVVEWIRQRAEEEGVVRVYPVGCITKGRQGKELAEMEELASAGVVAFSDDGDPVQDPSLMRLALTYGLNLGKPIINHCQEPSLSADGVMSEGSVATRLGLRGIPTAAEEAMAARDMSLAELVGASLHLPHVSTAGTVELVRQAKERGLRITAEVCPHHLTMTDRWAMGGRGDLAAESIELFYDTSTKVYPPLRSDRDVEALLQGLADGAIDCIATDHAPHDFASKMVTYQEAASGISVLETALGSLLGLVHRDLIDLPTLVERLTLGPARVLGNGFADYATLQPGTPADITLFDPEREWEVDVDQFASKGKNTPLHGAIIKGKVVATMVAGRVVYQDSQVEVSR